MSFKDYVVREVLKGSCHVCGPKTKICAYCKKMTCHGHMVNCMMCKLPVCDICERNHDKDCVERFRTYVF